MIHRISDIGFNIK